MSGMNRDDIYLAPNVLGDLPNVEQLEELTEAHPDRSDLLFLLANSYFRIGNLTGAVEGYRKLLLKEPGHAEVRCNLGIAYRLLGRHDEAVSELNQALLACNDLALAHRVLGEIRMESGDIDQAVTHLQRHYELEPTSVSTIVELAALYGIKGEVALSQQFYHHALELDPHNARAKSGIAEYSFSIGKKLFEEGDLDAAFLTWWKANCVCAPAFVTNENVARSMRELVKVYQRRNELNELFEMCQKKIKGGKSEPSEIHCLFARYYFSLGLLPDYYEPPEMLDNAIERWRGALQIEGDPPFPHFRIALAYAYQGNLDGALQELTICRDRLPERKQEGLRLKPIFDFIFKLRGKSEESESRELSEEEAGAWNDYGFPSLFQWYGWRKLGFLAAEAATWRDAGLSSEEAVEWRKKKITPILASRWYSEGFRDPGEVRRWVKGGFEPGVAKVWKAHFPHSMEVAIQCKQIGLDDPKEAEQWLRVFMFPWDAASWKECGFTPSEALTWTAAGFSNAFAARSYKNQGLTPESASRHELSASKISEIENEIAREEGSGKTES